MLAAAAAVAFLATVMLAVRTGDSAPIPSTEVLGARVTRQPAASVPAASGSSRSSKSSSTTASTTTTLVLETIPAGPITSQVFTSTTVAGAAATTSTTVSRSTTTTVASPRDVTEESDNTASYVWSKDGHDTASTTPNTQPASDPLTFLVSAHVDQENQAPNVAELDAKLQNNTDKPITFGPDGFAMRFLIDHDSKPWRTVEVKRDDIQTLPAHTTIEVIGHVYMDPQGYGTYDVGGEIQVRYT